MKIFGIFSRVLTPFRTGRVLQVRYLSAKGDKVALKELFPDLMNGHSNPKITKVIEVIGEAEVPREFEKLLDLRLRSGYGKLYFRSDPKIKQPDIFDSVPKGPLGDFGPESEAHKVEKNLSELQSEAKLCDLEEVLLEMQHSKSNQAVCLMLGLYLGKDLELLRAPHQIFNHVFKKAFPWTKEDTQLLMDNLTESDDVLLQKFPSKSLAQIKYQKWRLEQDLKAEIKNQPFTQEEDVQIAMFALGDDIKMPKSIEEFRQITKGATWTKLAESMKRPSNSLQNRFSKYIKPFIEAHILNIDLKEEIVRFNEYIAQQEIPSRDKIEWVLFPLSKPFYSQNINIHDRDWKRKDEHLWVVVKDRNERGFKNCFILPEDHGKAILKALS